MQNGYIDVKNVIENNAYHIPKYQRGYRWSSENVKKLLEDIYEDKLGSISEINNNSNNLVYLRENVFNLDENGNIINPIQPYCIQPLVVCECTQEDFDIKYDVIDGQQRLTTIAICIAALRNVSRYIMGNSSIKDLPEEIIRSLAKDNIDSIKENYFNKNDVFQGINIRLSYESRKGSEDYLNKLYLLGEQIDKDNIDYLYLNEAYKIAYEYYENILEGITKNENIYLEYLRDVLLRNTRFIWYQIDTSNLDPHEVFANFNTGKIALTNAGLIKAIFMDPTNYDSETIKDKQIVISEKWDEIENALHIPEFWAFIPHRDQYNIVDTEGTEYSTRIDVIFEFYIMDISKKNGKSVDTYIEERKRNISDKYIFNQIETFVKNELSNCNKTKTRDEIMAECWQKIYNIFLGLKELYEPDKIGNKKNRIYNWAGLYINLCNKKDGTVDTYIQDEFEYLKVYDALHEVLECKRNRREKLLLEKIVHKLKIIDSKVSLENLTAENLEIYVKQVRYLDNDKEKVVQLLLAYNIAILNNSSGIGERYNFLTNALNKWQREHIFACNVEESKDVESVDSNKERRAALEILSGESYKNYIKYLFPQEISNMQVKINEKVEVFNESFLEHRKEFIASNLAYSGNGPQELYARALRTQSLAQDMLENYYYIDKIEELTKVEDITIRRIYIYQLLTVMGKKFGFKESLDITKASDFIDIKNTFLKACRNNSDKEEITVSLGKWSLKNNLKIDDYLRLETSEDEAWSKFFSYIESRYRDDILQSFYDDENDGLFAFDSISRWELIEEAIVICKKTLVKNIDVFFKEDFAKLLKDNYMGNMTLLTGGNSIVKAYADEKASNLNQVVGNMPYKTKKSVISKAFKSGQFVTIGTIFVFSDMYNDGISTANFWLPDSRLKYMRSMVETLKNTFCKKEV